MVDFIKLIELYLITLMIQPPRIVDVNITVIIAQNINIKIK